MRMPLDFSQVVKDFVASGKKSQIVEIKPGQKRVLKINHILNLQH